MRFSINRCSLPSAVVAFALLHAVSAANIVVNGIQYYAASEAVTTITGSVTQLKGLSKDADLVPLTVIEASAAFDIAAFKSIVQNYTAVDDVFNSGFLEVVYLKGSSRSKISGYGTKLFMQSSSNRCSKEIPAGPYFVSVSTGKVFQAYRLYSDVQGAFTEGLIAKSDGTFDVLPVAVQGVQSSTIGVLSRLYYTKSEAKPLAGVRLGIKDIYDIAGVKTGCGNRAYYNLYPARNVTAVAVQRLIDAGAVIVGKMKTSQFANGETATADWVDYHSPFNPRGDGYQDPSSSSSGPGAGIGAYPWLDIALGSDTGGSVRNPAQVNGAFGNRPSHGLVSLDGAMPLSPALDTAGFFAREAGLWKTTAAALYGENITFTTSFPRKIYTSGFPVNASTEAQSVLLSFLSKLQAFLSAEIEAFDYDDAWNATGPVAGQNLSTYLGYVYPTLIAQQQYNLLTVPFYADYAAANQGRLPAVNPTPKTRWAWGQNNITAHALQSALASKTVFMDWWNTNVLVRHPETCSDSLFLYPGTLGTPSYRNLYKSAPGIPSGFSVSRISNFAEVPDMVAPIGMAPYNSTITGQVEYLPVAVDILAAKGCDGMVFELVERLQKAGVIQPVGTGSLLYSGEDGILV